ncbi:MAG: bifunctional precorrin-2 dehydrogenase/sirohydrochlorin ferrochelatase [Alphaproteobacteria bacterium]|nr:bifunctional precorrin-2 dehydrogenase/sirohydrochlorin ferrochelatase [Alphaproteobacteria bacterium]
MLPLSLDIRSVRIVLVGGGPQALGRLRLLDAAGAGMLKVFAEAPSDELAAAAGDRLVRRMAAASDLAGARLVFLADLGTEAEELAAAARGQGALVNREDVPHLCDFHMPAIVRRGDLLIAISTGGKAPGLARRLRERLEALFPEAWGPRLQRLAAERLAWKEAGASTAELSQRTKALIDREGWLP